jgi:predicted PurR-regulated permease PerM
MSEPVMSRDTSARRFLFLLLLGSMLLVGFVAWPLASALLLAAVLAVVLGRVQDWLSAKLGGRRSFAAAILVIAVLLLLIVPLVSLSAVLVKEATDGARFVLETVRSEGLSGLIDWLPGPVQDFLRRAFEGLGDLGQLAQKHLGEQGPKAASAVASAIAATGGLLFELTMMLIALFFLLVRGHALLAWLDDVLPLRPSQTRELAQEFKKVSYAVIVATLITAAVQTAAALVGYFIARVPHPLFFAGVTFFFAIIPAIGAGAVCLFAALILLATGHPYMAIFLAVWGVLVVGLIDNVVKPYLIKGDVEMGGAVVFFALIGGIAAFGMIGLVVGPLALAIFLALLRMYRRDYMRRSA